MIVYLAGAIQAFVMYCVNGTSRSSLLIESTDSMILVSGGGLALTHSYSERWQVARIGLCGLGAMCGVLAARAACR